MTITHETLRTLMSLVDNNSDQLKEGEYLNICKFMKVLFDELENTNFGDEPIDRNGNTIRVGDHIRFNHQRLWWPWTYPVEVVQQIDPTHVGWLIITREGGYSLADIDKVW